MNATTVLVYEKATTQNQQIIRFLLQDKYITASAAIEMGILNLKGRIFELRESGHQIRTEMKPFTTRLGKKGKYAVYHYEGFDENYVKPEPINNTLLLSLVKKYVIAKAEQMNSVYDSRFKAGKVTEASRDAMLKRHKELIKFVSELK